MKGEILFEKITNISEQYIAEASLAGGSECNSAVGDIPTIPVTPAPKKRFPYALIGGVAAACLCLVVSVATLVGMLAWGLTDNSPGSSSTPSSPTSPISPNTPLWQRFEFSYDITDGTGTPLASAALPGDTVLVDTTLINRGLPFFYVGSSSEFCAHAQFVLQGNEAVTINGGIFHTTDIGTFPVLMGEEGQGRYFFTIPENATPGVYDLVLSYKNTKQVFSGVLTVGNAAESPFDFGYTNIMSGPALRGTDLFLEVWVTNNGESFTSNQVFRPQATLYYADEATPYAIQGVLVNGTVMDSTPLTTIVESGQTGRGAYAFSIPEDAPTGRYNLVLSFGEASEIFESVFTVAERTETGLEPLLDYSFGYELGEDAVAGAAYSMDTWVINEGAAFMIEGSSMSFAPAAVLIHMETQYRIEGSFGMDDDYVTLTVNTGDVGRVTQEFFIPANAPTGAYALQLSYGGATKSFPGVVIVADSSIEQPTGIYNLTMTIGSDWLYEPIEKAYADGDEVTVRIRFATDVGTLFFLNGEVIPPSDGDDQMGYWEYRFIMPQKDSVIQFHTYDGMAPYGRMLEACIRANPYTFSEELFYCYGEFGDGVMVALQLGYGAAEWSTTVGGYTFATPNTHDMMAFHNGTLYDLQVAYDMGLLTDGDLEAMQTTHKKWFPYD